MTTALSRLASRLRHIMLLVTLTLGCTAALAQQPTVIRFGVSNAGVGNPPRITLGWTAVAQARGFLEEEFRKDNIKVEWIFFKGQGPAVNEALTNNQLDFTTLGDLPSIIGRAAGIKTHVVMVSSRGSNTYIAVKPDSPIRSVADLRGKRIGLNKGTATQLAINRILQVHGLSEKDVRIVNLEPASALAAFKSGDLDAIVSTLQLLGLRDQGQARIIYDTKQAPELTGQGHVLVNDAFAQRYPDVTQRVVKALVKAAQWAADDAHRDEVFKLWSSGGNVTTAMYQEEYRGVPLAQRTSPRFDPFVLARDRQSVEDAYRFNLIRKKFDVDKWIDSRYVEAAVKELKLESHWPRTDASGKNGS